MISAKQYFELAQLAEASYANLVDGNSALVDQLQNADDNMSFSLVQATEFATHWSVAAHQPNTDSGFSSTLFKSRDAGGGYVLAIRGTEAELIINSTDLLIADVADIVADGIVIDQSIDLYNEWKRITSTGAYSAAKLVTLTDETAAYALAKAGQFVPGFNMVADTYLAYLRARTDIIIDEPSGRVRTIQFESSATLFSDSRQTGLGLAADIAAKGVTVTGHSLGGHLADVFDRLFAGAGADAFKVNGAGFATGSIAGLSGNATINIRNLFGMLGGATSFDSNNNLNLYGDKNPEIVTMNGPGLFQQGGHEAIFIEQDSFFGNAAGHGASQMTDSLALYSLFATIDPSLNTANLADGIGKITKILKSASADPAKSLELTLDALRTLFQQTYQYGQLDYDAVPTTLGDTPAGRDSYYANLQSLQIWWEASPFTALTIQPLAEYSSAQIASLAMAYTPEGQAYRYAIVKLNPFAVTGSSVLYDGINAHGQLNRYNPANGSGSLTDQYLKDRTAMLSWKLRFGTNDTQPVGDTFVKAQGGTPFYFEDFTISTKMRIGGGDTVNAVMSRPLGDFNLVVFGSDNDDLLTGQGKADRLYGGSGSDSLTGNAGNDYLEGGAGNDTYTFATGDGFDTVLDSDGSGVIKLGTVEAKGSAGLDPTKWIKLSDDSYADTQNGITYTVLIIDSEPQLLINQGDSNVLIKGWEEGELGIALGAGTTPATPVTPDQLTGTAGADYLNSPSTTPREVTGGAGKDFIFGTAGADRLDGGADSDWIVGGAGADVITGGDGADYIVGLGAQTRIDGGAGNDIIDARLGASGGSQASPIDSATAWADLSQYLAPVYTAVFPPDGSDTTLSIWGGLTNGTVGGTSTKGNGWTYQFTFTQVNGVTQIEDRYFHPTQTGAQGIASGLVFNLYDQPAATGAGITVDGGDGDDLINGGAGMDVLLGGMDQDRLWGNGGRDMLEGGNGNDVLSGDDSDPSGTQHGDDYLDGGAGIDYIWGDGGADIILGGEGADRLEGDDTQVDGAAHGADILFGGLSNDYVWGDGGGDSLYGEDGDDYLQGDNGATAGAFHGNDLLDGGVGNDILLGDGGADTLMGGAGQDTLYGDNPDNQPLAVAYQGNDTLDGGDDNDLLYGQGGDDVLRGGAGVDGMDGGDGNDTIDGGDDADEMYGGVGNDTLVGGGGGMDYMNGGAGDDRYVFASGDGALVGGLADTIDDREGNNTIEFASGIVAADISATWVSGTTDVVLKYGATDYVYVRNALGGGIATVDFAGSEHKTMGALLRATLLANAGSVGNASNNLLYSGELGKLLDGQGGNDTLVGGAGNEAIYGGAGNDYLLGGAGSDTLNGSSGSDTYLFNLGDGVDTIYEAYGPTYIDVLKFGAGINPDDVMAVRVLGNLELQHVNGSDKVVIASWFDSYKGNGYFQLDKVEFADGIQWTQAYLTGLFPTIEGTSGNDTLNGSNSNDTLIGRSGNDTLLGGKGNDDLMGGDGSDTYKFNLGDGVDTIYEASGHSYFDVLEFGAGVNPGDITAARVGNNLELKHINGTDKVIIDRWFMSKGGFYQLDQVRFAGGTQWTQAQLTDPYMTVEGTSGNDTLTGGEYGETLKGLDGDDILNGAGGGDTLLGGSGNDTLNGSVWDDVLHGGKGNDILNGNYGSDTYLFDLGDGVDTIKLGYVNNSANYTNVLKFSVGINPGDITAARVGNNLELQHANGTDKVIIDNWYNSVGEQLDWVEFAEGTQWTQAQLTVPFVTIEGTVGNDALNSGELGETLRGLAGDDTLNGFAGNDILDGGVGADTLNGGTGNDTYVVDNQGDVVTETSTVATEIDTVQSSITYTLGTNVEHLTLTGTTAINGTGNELTNVLTGNSANNTLIGGVGDDILLGSTSGTSASTSIASLVIYARGTPVLDVYPAMQVYIDGVLIQEFMVDAASYTAYTVDPAKLGMAAGKVDVIFTNDAWRPDLGQDRNLFVQKIEVNGQSMNATDNGVYYDPGSGAAAFDGVNLRLGQDTLASNGALRFTLADNDTLDGGAGADQMSGGSGNDTYLVDSANDALTEMSNEGVDTVRSSISHTLGANFENLVLSGTAAINGTGNALVNLMVGNAGNNSLYGDVGVDTLIGNAGSDRLDGGAGGDFMYGGQGNDTYVVDSVGDILSENLNEGMDAVESSISHTLGANVESLTLTGTAAINGTGNNLDNALTGNSANNLLTGGAGNDSLDGGAGADVMAGGAGDDYYVVDNAGDIVTENAGEGISDGVELYLNADYAAGADIEHVYRYGSGNWTTTGNAADNYLYGNSGSDTLVGLAGNDVLYGDAGADTLIGGVGDDRYYVDSVGDIVTENTNEGVDTVYVFGSGPLAYTLAANVENGYSPFWAGHLTGNALDNMLSGSYGSDTLDGGLGADILKGWGGNDTYIVDNVGDVVSETSTVATEIDTVQSSVTYTLGANLENLTLTGTESLEGTGNALANVLRGNGSSSILYGLDGNDTLYAGDGDEAYGGAGNDTLVAQNTLAWAYLSGEDGDDTLTGGAGSGSYSGGLGNDTITGGAGYNYLWGDDAYGATTGGNDLILGGASIDNVWGGYGNDTLYGNDGNDTLLGQQGDDQVYGGTGNDILNGGTGIDTLVGGIGNDTYRLGRGYAADTAVENDATAGNTDIAQFLTGVAADQIWFQQVGNNLETSIIGTSDKLVIQDWYLGSANHVEQFKTTDGAKTLLDSNVQNLVNAMASFAPPAAGQTSLPTDYQTSLAPVIAANWQ
ncbi:calcium-binding protein [Thiobacillus sp.]|uniref:calcium-binding protein n=1 Tax=Thiobacillus sp. TaxID=924 RepID=UPI00286E5D80|nr:calcium-binding protein [Thiobacillus sp.]